MIRALLSCSLACSLGCAARQARQATPPDPPSTPAPPDAAIDRDMEAWMQARAEAAANGPAAAGSGASKNSPLAACGARGSYTLVADHECKDGSRPFDGDIPSAAGSRRGNVGPNDSGHIIDVYEVPCPGGPQQVFVDMYDCDNARPSRSELEVQYYIHEVFLAGDFGRFIRRCEQEDARGPDRVSLMLQTCVPAMPIALREHGKPEQAAAWLARFCAGTPAPTPEQPKRWRYLASVLDAHDVLREKQGRANERPALTAEYARVCDVDPVSFSGWLATADE